MKYNAKLGQEDIGRVFQFTHDTTPPPTYLKCGCSYPKQNYSPKIYNLFPADISSLQKNNFPQMTSTIAPAPYTVNASSYYTDNNWNCAPWYAFNYAVVGDHSVIFWLPRGTTSEWIEFNAKSQYVLYSYRIISSWNSTNNNGKTNLSWKVTIFNDVNNTSEDIHSMTNTNIQDITWGKYNGGQTYAFPDFLGYKPFTRIRWTFTNCAPYICWIAMNGVRYDEYLFRTTNFIIPANTPSNPNYTSYVYVGPNSLMDRFY
jgi:hypothetical protein